MLREVTAARARLGQTGTGRESVRAARVAVWHWNLASGRLEWDDALKSLFGYAERVTDAAWRVERIHPSDRKRVEASLQRATVGKRGGVWSEPYRFRQEDGAFVVVVERAYVLSDEAGPRAVLGAIKPTGRVWAPRPLRARLAQRSRGRGGETTRPG
jgi:PAS domain-containing protein